ncbi:MAG: hypothetical protein NVSMB10_03870 [Steroidobacteraceae bacterium]
MLLAGVVGAQPPDGAKPVGADTPAAADPSPDLLKQARAAGFKPEKRNGVTRYCVESADIGTRFSTKKCYDEDRLAMILQQRQLQREQTQHIGCGGACAAGH